jgi:nucleoside-diphosphate-sugar epimerase
MNVYGHSKAQGETLMTEAQHAGLRACIIRLSNVFGSTSDHADRVVPAFARAAAIGDDLHVEGANNTFDFTHIDDVTQGIATLIEILGEGRSVPPPIHFVSGQPTTLGQLATLAAQLGAMGSRIQHAEPRNYDVARFYGDPSRAKALLGWQTRVGLEEGLTRLVHAFRDSTQEATLCRS